MASLIISATEFKAKCLAILDDVEKKGNSVTVTKRGRPVATLGPAAGKRPKTLKGCLAHMGPVPEEKLQALRAEMNRALLERANKLSDEFSA